MTKPLYEVIREIRSDVKEIKLMLRGSLPKQKPICNLLQSSCVYLNKDYRRVKIKSCTHQGKEGL